MSVNVDTLTTLDDLLDQWDKDSTIDSTNLASENQRIPKLHAKYLRLLAKERWCLKQYETAMRQLKLRKHEFFVQGASKETNKEGWQLPPRGKPLNKELDLYMDADEHLNELRLKIEYSTEKIQILDNIIRAIHARNFVLKGIQDWLTFTGGA